jgi:hypothetical protein
MATKRKTNSKKSNNNKIRVVIKRTRRRQMRPSSAVMEYAKLLANPCTGPLVHAPGSSEGGQVVRFETDFILGNGATDTAGAFLFTPGAINSQTNNGYGFGGLNGIAVNDTTALTLTATDAFGGTSVPGYTFIRSNASSYRCIAACLQVYWPGSELNRAGIVAAAHGTYGLLNSAGSYTAAQLRAICPVVERMPTDHMEIKWAPNFSDGLFRNPTSPNAPEDGHSAILLTWAGIPVSTGVRIRCVCVYEWRPRTSGLVLSSNTALSDSAYTVQDVRAQLDKRDANWWNLSGQAAYHFLGGMTVAYAARRAQQAAQNNLRLEL